MYRAETIFALSSGRVPSAIAVVRVSGPQAAQALSALVGRLSVPRVATRALLRNAQREPIDDSLALWFPGPASATGEDVAEFHVHGGPAVLQALFAALLAIEGIRPAEPGEFTRRAFENGKLDLTEAEALDDLIHADTDRQRRQALRQLKGLLGDRARDWRAQIIDASALIAAGIDFADEADVPTELLTPALARINRLLSEIEGVLAAQGHSERLREGLVVAIAGPPNVGKSTLINQLARREVAIVSPYAGTTRDPIEVQLDLEGYPVTLIDTAGIRETNDPIEQEGVRRARHRAAEADLILWLDDGADAIRAEENAASVWHIRTKIDLIEPAPATGQPAATPAGVTAELAISATCGEGMSELMQALVRFAADHFGGEEGGLIGRARQRQWLEQAADALRRCVACQVSGEELMAEELRIASDALGRLLGRVDVEDVLEVIFRDFCIGK